MARGKAYDEHTRAAVLAALLAGQSVNAVARQYQLSGATVRMWRKVAGLGAGFTRVEPQKKGEIGDLLTDYLRRSLAAISVQVDHFADKAWLVEQSASELAVLHGVVVDKAIRLLEALQLGDDAREGDERPADVAR